MISAFDLPLLSLSSTCCVIMVFLMLAQSHGSRPKGTALLMQVEQQQQILTRKQEQAVSAREVLQQLKASPQPEHQIARLILQQNQPLYLARVLQVRQDGVKCLSILNHSQDLGRFHRTLHFKMLPQIVSSLSSKECLDQARWRSLVYPSCVSAQGEFAAREDAAKELGTVTDRLQSGWHLQEEERAMLLRKQHQLSNLLEKHSTQVAPNFQSCQTC